MTQNKKQESKQICPDCGSDEVWITETDDYGRWWYHCPECGRRWKENDGTP